MTFLIADGVLPGNEGRGYVLRKIMRRAIRHGQKLGIEGAFLQQLTHDVVARMKAAFPELVSHEEAVSRVVAVEEERFATTIRQAMAAFEQVVAAKSAAGAGRPPDRRAGGLPPLRHLRPPSRLPGRARRRPGLQRGSRRLRARACRAAGAGPAVEPDGRGEGRPRLHEARRGGREDRLPRLRGALGGGRPRPRGAEGRGARAAARGRRGGARRSRPDSLLRHVGRPGRRPGGDRLRRLGGRGHRHHEPPARPPRPPGPRHPRRLRARHGGPGRGRRRASRRRDAPPHGHAPAPRRPARDPRSAREAGRQPRGPRPPPLRLLPLRARRAARAAPHREPGERGDPARRPRRAEGHGPGGGPGLRGARLLRRQVRRARPRGRGPRLLEGVLRRHPRRPDRGDRPLPAHRRAGHLGRHPAGRGPRRRGGDRARPGRPGDPRGARAVGAGGPARAGRRVRAPARPAEGPRAGDPGPADEARHGGRALAGRGPLRDRGDPRLDPALRGARPQGPRRGGGRVPQPEQGAPLRARLGLDRRRRGQRDRRGLALAGGFGQGAGPDEAAGPARRGPPRFRPGGRRRGRRRGRDAPQGA